MSSSCVKEMRAGRTAIGRRVVLAAVMGLCMSWAAGTASATTFTANPGEYLLTKINAMQPGDTLLLNPGIYFRSSITMLYIKDKVGRPDAWFTIKAEEPGTVIIWGNPGKNICELRNSAYWRIENLELDGRGGSGDGVKSTFSSTDGNDDNDWNHDIVLKNLNIHNLTDACVNVQVTTWNLTVEDCWLHDCNLGAYMGNPDGYKQMINLVFQRNLIERTVGYGMEVKAQYARSGLTLGTTPGLEFQSWGCLIKDNVWRRTNPPANDASHARPNLLVDAGTMSGPGSDDIATIDGNVILGNTADYAGESGMQLSGNLRITNNIIVNVKMPGYSGIKVCTHSTIYPRRWRF